MKTILEIKNLVKSYGSGEVATKALNDVSFTMEQGGVYRCYGRFRLRKKYPAQPDFYD